MNAFLNKIRRCEICIEHLPLGPRPVVQLSVFSKIIIIGQAPGRRVHETGIPWSDASGINLREWLNVDEATFYDPAIFSILPMGFCYPGKGIQEILHHEPNVLRYGIRKFLNILKTKPLILLIGQYAQRYYLKKNFKGSLQKQ